MNGEFVTITTLPELSPGMCRSFEVQDRGVALFNVDGEVFALDNTCPHAGGPLGEGTLEGEVVSCPWHHWKFNVRTGRCLKNPHESWSVRWYRTRIVGDAIQVEIPKSP